MNHCGPLPLKELHSTGETIVWKDPGGSWACLPPVYKCNLPATVRDTCGIHPKQHTKKRGVIRNTKRPKSQEEELGCGQKKCIKKTQRQAIRMKGALWNVKRSEITKLTTIAGLKKAKEKLLKWTSQIRKEPYENHSEKNRVPRRRVQILVIEEGLAKSSKKQHSESENTDKWHLCKAGSFSYGETPWTPPLEGTSLHRWNNSVERPWRILSLFTTCLQVQSPCHSPWHMWNTPQTAH